MTQAAQQISDTDLVIRHAPQKADRTRHWPSAQFGLAEGIPSSALGLQHRLEMAFVPEADIVGKWSNRRALAFAVVSSAVLWSVVGLSIYAVLA